MTQPDLDYNPDSFAGRFDESKLRDVEAWLHRSEHPSIVFDQAYVDHLKQFHGGRPRKSVFCIQDETSFSISSFHHFADLRNTDPRHASNAFTSWSLTDDRMGSYLFPFADLLGGDMLCFDYSKRGRPRVVVWLHEESMPDEPPATKFVANNFDEFLNLLEYPEPYKDPRIPRPLPEEIEKKYLISVEKFIALSPQNADILQQLQGHWRAVFCLEDGHVRENPGTITWEFRGNRFLLVDTVIGEIGECDDFFQTFAVVNSHNSPWELITTSIWLNKEKTAELDRMQTFSWGALEGNQLHVAQGWAGELGPLTLDKSAPFYLELVRE